MADDAVKWNASGWWSPGVHERNVVVELIKQLEALYQESNNPVFVWRGRVIAKLLAPDDRELARWVEEYLDRVGDQLMAPKAPPGTATLADGVVAALGFKPFEPGSKWPASMAKTAMRHEMMAIAVWGQLTVPPSKSEERATETVAKELGVSHRTVRDAWRAFKRAIEKK